MALLRVRYRRSGVPAEYPRSFRLLCLLCTLASALCGEPPQADRPALERRVLIISSYHQGDAWNDSIVHAIETAFRNAPQKVEADFEYMDVRRHPEASHEDFFVKYLHNKLADAQPDLIVTSDDPALWLVLNHRGAILPAVPVVFCGINDFRGSAGYITKHPETRPWLAGVLERVDPDGTVDTALELTPKTREIVTLAAQPYSAADILARHPGLRVRYIDAANLPIQETEAQLEHLGEGSILLFSNFTRHGRGDLLDTRQTAALVARHTHVPIYTLDWPALGYGPVGGKMSDPSVQGQTAANMALSILAGVPPSALGIQQDMGNLLEFDWQQLRRCRIREADLPKGSIIINRPKTFTESHPLLIAAFCVFLCVQTLIIGILLVQRKRRQLAEAALRRHSQQLANSNYMLEQFAYITAHDFQEPIRSVALFAELLHRGSLDRLDTEGQQSVKFIFENSRRLHAMLRGLLAWVRSVEAPPDSPLWCDANPIWLEVLERHAETIASERVSVKSGRLPSLAVHPHHLRELLNHLLENALQHADVPDLLVSIRSEREDNCWKVTLFNSGRPIPETLQSRVFGVFRRLHSGAPGQTQKGVGMGLAICRRIVDYYGGRIWVESGAGEGCAFCFTIPDTPRPRARRPHRSFRSISFLSSTHAHSDR